MVRHLILSEVVEIPSDLKPRAMNVRLLSLLPFFHLNFTLV